MDGQADPVSFDHIAFAMHDFEEGTPFFEHHLGGLQIYSGFSKNFGSRQWSYGGRGCIECLTPPFPSKARLSKKEDKSATQALSENFVERFLQLRGPGFHHITFLCPDFNVAVKRAKVLGFNITNYNDEDPSWQEFFIHPKHAGGIVIQIAHSTDTNSNFIRNPLVTILGIHLLLNTKEKAVRQFKELLRGDLKELSSHQLEFRYGDGNMKVWVTIDPNAQEGPICVLFTTHSPLPIIPPGTSYPFARYLKHVSNSNDPMEFLKSRL